jgi:hypothetical protein
MTCHTILSFIALYLESSASCADEADVDATDSESRDTPDANPRLIPWLSRYRSARGNPKLGFILALVTMKALVLIEESMAVLMLNDLQESAKLDPTVTNFLLMLLLRVNAGTP